MYKKYLVAGLVTSFVIAAPFAASALSIEELQAQIKELLGKVATLQIQLKEALNASTTSSPIMVKPDPVFNHRVCGLLNRNLVSGIQGDDVRGLQEFLHDEGFLSTEASGYFGAMTKAALANWQTSQGVSAIGSFGPISRERIKHWCGGDGNSARFSAEPRRGAAPLTVVFKTNVTLANPNYVADAGDYKIVFGDGGEEKFSCTGPNSMCPGPHRIDHTYRADGTYVATLVHYGYFGPPGPSGLPERVVGRVIIYVGDSPNDRFSADPERGPAPLSVHFAYKPATDEDARYWIDFGDGQGQVMDVERIYCIKAPCISPSVAKHTYQSAGTYVAAVSRYVACLHTNPRCMIAEPAPLAQTKIVVTDVSSENRPPVISSFSGPTLLSVDEQGTWKITASDPENGELKYSILWGDEWTYADASVRATSPQASIQQDTSFTHSYARAGMYKVSLTVTDNAGKEARATATVSVSQTPCTAQYEPVCGRPRGCANTCPPGLYCLMMCRLYDPQTYGNRCELNNANADFIHEGVCTGSESY
ncbi:peptidoglycan-binding protein [Candidatus Kaiserbacteria bacterium]|nr:peptidoglycan-binding protein [Candidatus Kaiserbacteria bacterium]